MRMSARVENPPKPSPPNFGYALDKELLDIEEASISFPEPNLKRLEQLERMLETMDRMDPSLQGYHNALPPHTSFPPPPHHHPHHHHHRLPHQMDQRVPTHHLDQREGGRGWIQYQQDRLARTHPLPHPPPPAAQQQLGGARQQQQHQMLPNSRNPNNWAVEMEQRRLLELRQMQLAKEKEMYGGGGLGSGGGGAPMPSPQGGYSKGPSSKPNISLLPTAVMRHIHTSKPSQTVSPSKHNNMDRNLMCNSYP